MSNEQIKEALISKVKAEYKDIKLDEIILGQIDVIIEYLKNNKGKSIDNIYINPFYDDETGKRYEQYIKELNIPEETRKSLYRRPFRRVRQDSYLTKAGIKPYSCIYDEVINKSKENDREEI
jgi:hypothetical protein